MEYDGEKFGDETKTRVFEIAPRAGYFVIKNLALGLGVDYSSEVKKSGDVEIKNRSLVMGPIARYYIGSSKIKPFVQGEYVFGSLKQEDTNGEESWRNSEQKMKSAGWTLGGGVAMFLNDYISLDLGLGYYRLTHTDDEDDKRKMKFSGVGLDLGFSVVF